MSKFPDTHRYDDIIDLPHPQSKTRPHMSMDDRAAQFSPFAALTGHAAALQETARLTDRRLDLDEDMKAKLDKKLHLIQEHLHEHPEVAVTYFVPDEKKIGGAYVMVSGKAKKLDSFQQILVLQDSTTIPIADILSVSGKLFDSTENM